MFEDKVLQCRDCGADFAFSANEQDFYAQKGFTNPPGRCKECRAQHKREQQNTQPYANAAQGNWRNPAPNYGYGAQANYNRPAPSYGYNRPAPNYSSVGRGTGQRGYAPQGYGNSYGYDAPQPYYDNSWQQPAEVRRMYPIVCANCGIETQVPFQPNGTRPVFCSQCYTARRPQQY